MLITRQDARTIAGIAVEVRWAEVPPAPAPGAPALGKPSDASAGPDNASSVLTAFEFARYQRLAPAPARVFLTGRRLLRDLVAEIAAVDGSEVAIEARCPLCGGAHGRPAVVAPRRATTLRVSLAHTDSVVVAAAAWDSAVGVDVERSDAAPAPERDRAIATVAGASGDDALAHWTRVEAVLKADGRGLRVDPRRVRFTMTGRDVEARIDASDGSDGTVGRYGVAALDLGPGFTASVAVRI